MKIRIYIQDIDGDGDKWIDPMYKYVPFEGAYCEKVDRIEEKYENQKDHNEQYIDYDYDGKPFIANRHTWEWLPNQQWWIDGWKKYGKDHRYDAEKHCWYRTFTEYDWYIDMEEPEMYKQLVDLVANGYISEINQFKDGHYEIVADV